MSDEPVFTDFVVDDNPQEGTLPKEKIDEAISQHVSPLASDQKKEEAEKEKEELDKLREDSENRKRLVAMRRKFRLEELKNDKEITRYAGPFMMDMSGVERLSIEYKITPWLKVRFRSLSAELIEEITHQNVRDMIVGRIRFPDEVTYLQTYRMAGSLQSLTLCDPQAQGTIRKHYDYEESLAEVKKFEVSEDEFLPTADYLIRKRYLYVQKEVLNSGMLLSQVQAKFSDFAAILDDMAFLMQEDPDFFLRCLSEESSTD